MIPNKEIKEQKIEKPGAGSDFMGTGILTERPEEKNRAVVSDGVCHRAGTGPHATSHIGTGAIEQFSRGNL
uniref:Peptidase_S8 domain-containing protein n=1 Tax=Ascaris lumbricoides TaxID=6252 RepID=A0A0M3IF35_ASCLU